MHHVAGRNNSDITVPLCVGCHIDITHRQMAWDSRWIQANNSENLKLSFLVQGIYELLVEKHFKTGIRAYRLLADSLCSLIRRYRERA